MLANVIVSRNNIASASLLCTLCAYRVQYSCVRYFLDTCNAIKERGERENIGEKGSMELFSRARDFRHFAFLPAHSNKIVSIERERHTADY